jgi:hypothetical protein
MQTKVWIYFSKTGTGYEAKGEDIISAFDAFVQMNGTFLIELSFSALLNDMNFFIYEWDNSQRKRKTIYESYKKEIILELPDSVKNYINKLYLADELELEANANS